MEQYTNIRVIADKLMRNPLMSDITFETIIDYTIDFMRILGVPQIFEDKIETITITDYRGKMPCCWYDTQQIKMKSCRLDETMLRHSTDTFHLEKNRNRENVDRLYHNDPTFKIQGDYIFTSFKKGELTISYRAIKTDEEGFPALPDNSNFTRALESYIKKEHFSILFDLNKISRAVYDKTDQEYAWRVGSAISDLNKLDLSKAESLFNSWSTLLVRANEFNHGFRNNGSKEYIKNQ